MKFGIFYEHQIPRPWDVDSEYKLFHESLEQIELADNLGYDYAWEVEHHFLEEYSHSSAPEVFLGAASQRTKNIRLGHGVIQLTTNHPARVAERVSTLDLLSHGRVEFGMGEAATTAELHPFGRRFRDKRQVWEEAVRAVMPMFRDDPVEFHGEFFDLPLRNVIPKPFQKPHPPLWVACSQRDTIEKCGEWGMGALGFQFVSADEAHAWVNAYYNAFTKRQKLLADYQTNANIAVVSGFMCCETDEEAHVKADGWTFFAFALRFYATHKPGEGEQINLWEEYQAFKASDAGKKMHAGGLIGSPETIRTRLHKFVDSHVDQVILLNQAGKNTHKDICASLELFAKEVMPEFQALDGEHQKWKQAVLAGEIQLEEVDTSPEALPRPQRIVAVDSTA
jgi:alkanesulfonate monooxygenase SsuD/methylene tetrahydromethanopterin reductase-like flavin-dependent oxidoreductase (luciferase family)